jgi:hypothetical protein
MSEANLRRTFREYMSPFGVLHRVENKLGGGTPDAAFCLTHPAMRVARSGWVEFKHVEDWPKRATTPFRIKSLTREQADFLYGWVDAGGRAFLLIRVADTLFLHSGRRAPEIFDGVGVERFLTSREAGWPARPFPTGGLLRCLAG